MLEVKTKDLERNCDAKSESKCFKLGFCTLFAFILVYKTPHVVETAKKTAELGGI